MKKSSFIISLSSLLLLTACDPNTVSKEEAIDFVSKNYDPEKAAVAYSKIEFSEIYNVTKSIGSVKDVLPINNQKTNWTLAQDKYKDYVLTVDDINNEIFLKEFLDKIKLGEWTNSVKDYVVTKYYLDNGNFSIEHLVDMHELHKLVQEKTQNNETSITGKCSAKIVLNDYGFVDSKTYTYNYESSIAYTGKSAVINGLEGTISTEYSFYTRG